MSLITLYMVMLALAPRGYADALLRSASAPLDPLITPGPKLVRRQDENPNFWGWGRAGEAEDLEVFCPESYTYSRGGLYDQCCREKPEECQFAVGCDGNTILYDFRDGTTVLSQTSEVCGGKQSICNTAYLFEFFEDLDPRLSFFCWQSSTAGIWFHTSAEAAGIPPYLVPPETTSETSTPSSSSSSAVTSSESTPTSTTTTVTVTRKKSSSKSWIAAAVIVPIAFLASLVGGILFFFRRRRNRNNGYDPASTGPSPGEPTASGPITSAPAGAPQTVQETAETFYSPPPYAPKPYDPYPSTMRQSGGDWSLGVQQHEGGYTAYPGSGQYAYAQMGNGAAELGGNEAVELEGRGR
ncbi:hypothetical protein M011DRAFT_338163 [Sporormia fimetaria CBS 119925]|uniref:Mid2 domain-containing protein n=1 Tax=Sporormia fimetaria CBS 119925 TaxID=1340428 RepID=A0A6A6VG90_9PLEO|nr:hypothetical protein M011DRAFT_338163 [Sporormia fimetaria CBS 119925]